jgi:hypothetical protein
VGNKAVSNYTSRCLTEPCKCHIRIRIPSFPFEIRLGHNNIIVSSNQAARVYFHRLQKAKMCGINLFFHQFNTIRIVLESCEFELCSRKYRYCSSFCKPSVMLSLELNSSNHHDSEIMTVSTIQGLFNKLGSLGHKN